MFKKVVITGIVLAAVAIGLLFWTGRNKKNATGETALPNASPAAVAPAPADALQQSVEDIVARYRKTIVLLAGEESLPEADRERASLVGRIIFQENHQALSNLSNDLTAEIEKADFAQPIPHVVRFLDLIETQQDLHDADKLSFREVFTDLAESLSGVKSSAPAKAELESRVDSDRKALAEIQSLYEKELDKIFGRFETRGMVVRREAWERYVAYLHTKYKREDIMKAYEAALARINFSAKAGHQDSDLETYGSQLPPKTFVLTFDDGPHVRYTDRIVNVLEKYQIKSVFFELGTNLGRVKNNKIEPTRAASAARHVVEAGLTIGSHGLSHSVLPKMSDSEIGTEIDETNRLIQTVVNVRPALFRPPYGERDPKVLAAVDAHKMKSILWNIDSKDWADPIAKSIANRVIAEARRYGHGIILMHDIHERTIDALPLVIETLKGEGYRFVSWNGQGFVEDAKEIVQAAPAAPDPPPVLYHDSWAVIVGIDNYAKWPKLHYAVNDANGMKEILLSKFRFKPDHVITLLNEEATRENILSALGDTLSNPKNVQRDDRVFVFFAGHGTTRKLPSGRDLGYIIPVEADAQNFQGQSISMTNFQDISESIPAKHVFFLMDSCYSGLGITRGGEGANNYLREMSRRTARQMLTAGGTNEEVADNGPNGHSVFTWTVLQGLEGRADLNSDGYITAAELAAYVGPGVSALSHQTPAFGNLPGSEGGEFIFELHPETEFLSELSKQLDQEAIQINAELDRIRKDVAAKTARNEELRAQLAAAKSQQAQGATVAAPPKVADTARNHLNKGDHLYKEKRYPEALAEFLAAAKLDPTSAVAANNVGFLYNKLGKFDEALRWTEKATTLDPRRIVAYQNLGDLYYQLNRMDDARRNYEKFLQLAPDSSYAPTARARLDTTKRP